MNEENPSTDATFDRLLDELHGIQSGQVLPEFQTLP